MHKLVLGFVSLLSVTACVKIPAFSYKTTRFHRKNLHNQPCIAGRIAIPLKRDGRVQYISIFLDKQIFYPDMSGYYSINSQPGVHTIRFGTIGFRLVSVKDLHLRAGDSIRLDVHLQQDTSHLIN
jgi:hypothetical protein